MTNWERLKQENNSLNNAILDDIDAVQRDVDMLAVKSHRLSEMAKYSSVFIDNIDNQFEKATKLNKTDIAFLFFATALQCVRQYVIGTITQRTDDKTQAKKTKGDQKESSDRKHQLYKPTINEIITNPVPFDAIYGSKNFDLEIGGGFNHRAKTLGHDPILGWVFGTMNIATSTVTTNTFRSYHVLTGYDSLGRARDKISKRADTYKVLQYSVDKMLYEGTEGKEKIGVSLLKEALHLKSDMYSYVSLPVPIISTISVDVARKLADHGIDMGNITKIAGQAEFAILVNSLIGMIHGLYYDESEYYSWDMYSVKTRKILSYSNVIASASNVIAVAIAATVGTVGDNPELVKKSLNYLDISGIIVAIHRVVKDRQFICNVKQEFLEKQWFDMVSE